MTTLEQLKIVEKFVVAFNDNIVLRESLWKDGFYSEIHSLPGLIKHELEVMRFQSKIYYRLIGFGEEGYSQYFEYVC